MNILKVRKNQGYQAIRDIRNASINPMHRGLPVLDPAKCSEGCSSCAEACPGGAISSGPLSLDLGRCVFCGACAEVCPAGAVGFTPYYKLSSRSRDGLVLATPEEGEAYRLRVMEKAAKEIRRLFGRSFKIREVSAGGCNGCEMELNACSNVNFDMGRFGIDVVASPRHADGILLSGPVSENMAEAFKDAWEATPGAEAPHPRRSLRDLGRSFSRGRSPGPELLRHPEARPLHSRLPGPSPDRG